MIPRGNATCDRDSAYPSRRGGMTEMGHERHAGRLTGMAEVHQIPDRIAAVQRTGVPCREETYCSLCDFPAIALIAIRRWFLSLAASISICPAQR